VCAFLSCSALSARDGLLWTAGHDGPSMISVLYAQVYRVYPSALILYMYITPGSLHS
jgi:hypothetical protein